METPQEPQSAGSIHHDVFFLLRHKYLKVPDILKTVRVVNVLSVVNLLRVVIHCWKCSESVHFVLIYYIFSSESLCVVNSLQSSKTLRSNQTPYWKQYGRVLWVSEKSLGVHKILVRKIGFTPPPQKGPKWGKTVWISRKSWNLTLFLGGGERNFMDKTILRAFLKKMPRETPEFALPPEMMTCTLNSSGPQRGL